MLLAHSTCSPYARWCGRFFFLVQMCVFCSLFVILYCGFRSSMYYDSTEPSVWCRRRHCRRRRCLALGVLMFALFCWCWCHCCCCCCCWLLLFWFRFAYSHTVLVYIRVYFCVKHRIVVYFSHSSNFLLVFVSCHCYSYRKYPIGTVLLCVLFFASSTTKWVKRTRRLHVFVLIDKIKQLLLVKYKIKTYK